MAENKQLNELETEKVAGGEGVFAPEQEEKLKKYFEDGDFDHDPVTHCKCKNCGKEYTELSRDNTGVKHIYCKECREKLGF
ncbi:MAG: hypothetical protein Q4D57_05995 [Clostridia bacterium]|nr:hypothetical protein [Clostridia bacterium]